MTTFSFYAMTMPGLETTAFSEIREHMPDATLIKFSRGIVLFRTSESPMKLLALRTVEDIFATIAHIKKLGRGYDALRVLHSATLNADIGEILALRQRTYHGKQLRTWRVISQKEGTHEFRRMDAGKAVSDALYHTLPRKMKVVADDSDAEFWLWLHGDEALIGLRLSDATMRHRTYKLEHLPASLRPSVAAAMGFLSRPTPEDSIVDPLCGAGTIIIERALLAPFKEASGGDIRKEAVAMAQRNAGAANVKATWQIWDASSLPLEAASVNRIITNLPFGKQIGSHENNIKLYNALAPEFERILAPNGMLVTLTSEDRLWEMILHDHGWNISKKVVLVILGQPASIFIAEKNPGMN
jgi:tRNA (guanine6-N2)-methyltransferase